MTRPAHAGIVPMSISFSPIGPWFAIVVASLVVMVPLPAATCAI